MYARDFRDEILPPELRQLRFGRVENGEIGIGVFPGGEKGLIRGARGRLVLLRGIGTGES